MKGYTVGTAGNRSIPRSGFMTTRDHHPTRTVEAPEPTMNIVLARSPRHLQHARALFEAYAASLSIDLGFQGLAAELDALHQMYAAPRGGIFLAYDEASSPVGCAAFRPCPSVGPTVAEMKRLFVQPAARGHRLGCRLAERTVRAASAAGYQRMVLDTLRSMTAARAVYAQLGFEEVAAYYDNPVPDVVYMAAQLAPNEPLRNA